MTYKLASSVKDLGIAVWVCMYVCACVCVCVCVVKNLAFFKENIGLWPWHLGDNL